MQTTINISLNVPPSYQVDKLAQQLTDYGKWLIITMNQPQTSSQQYRHQSLRGLTRGLAISSKELIADYMKEKYNV